MKRIRIKQMKSCSMQPSEKPLSGTRSEFGVQPGPDTSWSVESDSRTIRLMERILCTRILTPLNILVLLIGLITTLAVSVIVALLALLLWIPED